jgi:plasmid replication initiation protein
MTVMARRLLFAGMAQVQLHDESDLWVSMSVPDLIAAMGLSRGRETYQTLRNSTREVMQQIYEVDTGDGGWEMYQWIRYAEYKPESDTINVCFDPAMHDMILEVQRDFSTIRIRDFAKFTRRHSQRLFELLTSNSGHAGQSGNEENSWWWKVTRDELRKLLRLNEHEYRRAYDFRKWCVDEPVQDINEADVGLHVRVEYQYHRRRLHAFTFRVKQVQRDDARDVSPATQTERDQDELIREHPDLWEEAQEEARKQQHLPFGESSVRGEAWEIFRRWLRKKR